MPLSSPNHLLRFLIAHYNKDISQHVGKKQTLHQSTKKKIDYRPISLLSCIGKTMERCVHKYLYNYISQNNILTPLQSGFISGDSTTNQLLNIYHIFCEAVDNGKEVRVVFCDISKAFDRIWHKGLLFKLVAIGCSKYLLRWFTSYLGVDKELS